MRALPLLRLTAPLVALAFGVILAGPAGADPITETFLITSDHCGPNGTRGCLDTANPNAGTISVTDSGTGTLSYTVNLAPGFGIINAGGTQGLGASFGFNLDVNQVNISITSPTTGFSIVNGPSPVTSGSIHIDGFGNFDYGLNCDVGGACGNGGSSDFTGTLSFNVTSDVVGKMLTLNDIVQSTAQGSGGSTTTFFALDVLSPTGATGPVDASTGTIVNPPPPTPTPEPASLVLLGSALVGFGVVARRRGNV